MPSENLRREIERAQEQLFGDSPALKRPREASSDDADHRGKQTIKRTKTGPSTESAKSIRTPDRRKTTKTYGSSNRHLHDLFDDSNPQFDVLKEVDTANPRSASTSGEAKLSFGFSDSSDGAKWDLPPSALDDFARNDPSMFPEASSTVPDNTYDQQRMLETALADRYCMPAPVVPAKDKSSSTGSSSIPWSAYLATQNKSQASQNPPPAIAEPKEDSAPPVPPAVEEPTTAVTMESHTPVGSPTHGSMLLDFNPPQNLAESEPVHVAEPLPEVLPSSKSKKKRQREEDDLTRSDELAIGLPKEQYKPRHSRLRSAQMVSQPIDLSVAPERAAKKKPKRAKTADSPVASTQSPSFKNIQAMGEMGFTPNRARQALTESNGNLEEAIDGLLNRSASQREQQERIEQHDERTSNRKSVAVHAEDTSPDNDSIELEKQARRELVAVEIPQMDRPVMQYHDAADTTSETYVTAQDGIASREKSADVTEQTIKASPKGSSKKGKRKKASSHDIDRTPAPASEVPSDLVTSHETASDMARESFADEVPPQPPKEKKRGRGRPRKATKVIAEEAEKLEEIAVMPTEQVTIEKAAEAIHEPLKEIDANRNISNDAGSADGSKDDPEPTETLAESAEPPQSPVPQSENAPDATRSRSASKAPASQSPAAKGKVSYRVGLSRKARIAPLLKNMRK